MIKTGARCRAQGLSFEVSVFPFALSHVPVSASRKLIKSKKFQV